MARYGTFLQYTCARVTLTSDLFTPTLGHVNGTE